MNRLLVTTAALAALSISSIAQAQTPPPPALTPPTAGEQLPPAGGPPPPPPPVPGELRAEPPMGEMPPPRGEGRGPGDMRADMPWHHKGPGMRGPGRHGPRDRGARFVIEQDQDGTVRLDIKCADGEPMKACADISMMMLDRLIPAE